MKINSHEVSSVLTQPIYRCQKFCQGQLFSDILEVILRKKSETGGELYTSYHYLFAKVSNKLNELKPDY